MQGQMMLDLDFGVGRTSPEPSPAPEEKTSEKCLRALSRSSKRSVPIYLSLKGDGTTQGSWMEITGRLPGEPWMPNFTESPRDAEESFLSQILMDTVQQKYYLSERACLGILRRSHNRGKTLPEVLLTALKRQAGLSEEMYEQMKAEWMK